MKFGEEVLDYRQAEEAEKLIGKKGIFGNYLRSIIEYPSDYVVSTLMKIDLSDDDDSPFIDSDGYEYQFFRPIIEEKPLMTPSAEKEPLMTNYQLAEWLARGNGQWCLGEWCRGDISITPYSTTWEYDFEMEDNPVRDGILIRRWNTIEWVRPTRNIFEDDIDLDSLP